MGNKASSSREAKRRGSAPPVEPTASAPAAGQRSAVVTSLSFSPYHFLVLRKLSYYFGDLPSKEDAKKGVEGVRATPVRQPAPQPVTVEAVPAPQPAPPQPITVEATPVELTQGSTESYEQIIKAIKNQNKQLVNLLLGLILVLVIGFLGSWFRSPSAVRHAALMTAAHDGLAEKHPSMATAVNVPFSAPSSSASSSKSKDMLVVHRLGLDAAAAIYSQCQAAEGKRDCLEDMWQALQDHEKTLNYLSLVFYSGRLLFMPRSLSIGVILTSFGAAFMSMAALVSYAVLSQSLPEKALKLLSVSIYIGFLVTGVSLSNEDEVLHIVGGVLLVLGTLWSILPLFQWIQGQTFIVRNPQANTRLQVRLTDFTVYIILSYLALSSLALLSYTHFAPLMIPFICAVLGLLVQVLFSLSFNRLLEVDKAAHRDFVLWFLLLICWPIWLMVSCLPSARKLLRLSPVASSAMYVMTADIQLWTEHTLCVFAAAALLVRSLDGQFVYNIIYFLLVLLLGGMVAYSGEQMGMSVYIMEHLLAFCLMISSFVHTAKAHTTHRRGAALPELAKDNVLCLLSCCLLLFSYVYSHAFLMVLCILSIAQHILTVGLRLFPGMSYLLFVVGLAMVAMISGVVLQRHHVM